VVRLDAEVDAFHATSRLVRARALAEPIDAGSVEDGTLVVVAAAFLTNPRVSSADSVQVVVAESLAKPL
jgi:hypothetical protein